MKDEKMDYTNEMIKDTEQKLIASKIARIVMDAFELGCEFGKREK